MAGSPTSPTTWTHLYRLRRTANLHRRDVAHKVGCSYTHYCDIERGWSQPGEDLRDRLAALFDVDSLDLERTMPPARPRTSTPRERVTATS